MPIPCPPAQDVTLSLARCRTGIGGWWWQQSPSPRAGLLCLVVLFNLISGDLMINLRVNVARWLGWFNPLSASLHAGPAHSISCNGRSAECACVSLSFSQQHHKQMFVPLIQLSSSACKPWAGDLSLIEKDMRELFLIIWCSQGKEPELAPCMSLSFSYIF